MSKKAGSLCNYKWKKGLLTMGWNVLFPSVEGIAELSFVCIANNTETSRGNRRMQGS